MRRGIVWALAAVGLAGVLAVAVPRGGRNLVGSDAAAAASASVPPATGKAIDFTLTDVSNGKPVKLSSLKGNVVLLSFWATWCPPCRMELPHLQALHTHFRGKKVKVLAVNLDLKGDALKKWLAQNKLTFTALQGADTQVPGQYGVQGIPTLLVIDKQGGIRERSEGFDPSMEKRLTTLVDALLKL